MGRQPAVVRKPVETPLTRKTRVGDRLTVEYANSERESFVPWDGANPSHTVGVLTRHDGIWWWAEAR